MIPPNDLRIGNVVLYNGYDARIGSIMQPVPLKVSTLSDKWCVDINLGGIITCSFDEIEGIPLTVNLLKKAGFKPFCKDWQLKGLIIHTRKRGFVVRKSMPIVKCLHNLQNVYYWRTGNELSFKTKQDGM